MANMSMVAMLVLSQVAEHVTFWTALYRMANR